MNEPTGIEREVCIDIAYRQRKGIKKYKVSVADNREGLKFWLIQAYEETLDNAIYLKRAIREIEDSPLDPDIERAFRELMQGMDKYLSMPECVDSVYYIRREIVQKFCKHSKKLDDLYRKIRSEKK